MKLYCLSCSYHTEHKHSVDSYVTTCTKCGSPTPQLERNELETHTYTAPDGEQATVVRNDKDTVVFSIDKGQHRGYYVYDKNTGFGAIQKRG